ncbi:MAG: metal-dependent phosphohydrolase sub domain protein [Thermoleophilia bacterium]|nr:metal-dependent phosphohydrolase sub domain protein [Thermoleophilia bacterium]
MLAARTGGRCDLCNFDDPSIVSAQSGSRPHPIGRVVYGCDHPSIVPYNWWWASGGGRREAGPKWGRAIVAHAAAGHPGTSRRPARAPMRLLMSPIDPTPPPAPGLWRAYRPAIWAFAIASVLVWGSAASAPSGAELWMVVTLVLLGNLADLAAVRIQAGMRVSAAHFAAPFAVIAASVPGGLVAAAACLLGRLVFNRRDWNLFDIGVNVTAASVCGTVWELSSAAPGDDLVLPSVLTVVAFALVRSLVNAGWAQEARSRGIDIPPLTVPIGRLMLAAAMLFTPAIALFQIDQAGPAAAITLLALPFLATQFLIRQFGRERELNRQLEAANLSLTESLVNALDARDPYSAGHSIAVAVYSRDIAREIGLPQDLVRSTYLAGLLHDIGKIAVPDAILRKPAALTDEEFEEIRLHPTIGEQILEPSEHLQDVLPGVRHHHERIDGKGYPDRLRDADIPLQARIISVADAYNAMTSDRPYRDAMHPELAQRILLQNQGMQHDPFLVAAFRRVLATRGAEYAIAQGEEFATSTRLRDLMRSAAEAAEASARGDILGGDYRRLDAV